MQFTSGQAARRAARPRGPSIWLVLTGIWMAGCGLRGQPADTFVFTSPPAGEVVSGPLRLEVSGLPENTASVEYAVGPKILGGADQPPFALAGFNSALLLDGEVEIEARARDAGGNLVALTRQAVRIDNRGVRITLESPALNRPLSGRVTLSLTTTDTEFFPTFWFVNLDGEQVAYADTGSALPQHTVSKTISFDTTAVPNGLHELNISVHSWEVDGTRRIGRDYRGLFSRWVTIENTRQLVELVPDYLHLYLAPGEQASLTCTQLFTDHSTAPCPPRTTYASSTGAVAAVDARGVVTGGTEGFSEVTLTSGGKSAKVYVWVRPSHNVPHLSGNGRILSTYSAGESLFVTAPFVLEPAELSERVPGLIDEVRKAAVNTLQQGFYPNPRTLTRPIESWKADYDRAYAKHWQYAAAQGLHLLPAGDDVARSLGTDAWYTLNWPGARQAIAHAVQRLVESGVTVGIDMVDEASMIWGATPIPPGRVGEPGSFSSIACSGTSCLVRWPNNPVTSERRPFGTSFVLAGSSASALNTPAGRTYLAEEVTASSFRFTPAAPVTGEFNAGNDSTLEFLWWGGKPGGCPGECNPPIPNHAIRTFVEWVRAVPGAPPVSWPALGIHPPVIHGNWHGKLAVENGISDYASHYWDTLKGRKTYPWGWGTAEATTWMRNAFYARQNVMDLNRPQLMLTSLMGPMYRKGAPGAAFNPPLDVLLTPGTTPQAVSATIMTAAALGAAGVRMYSFDPTFSRAARSSARNGSELQTGADPFYSNTENWRAMAYANNLITQVLEPYVLGTSLSSPGLGRNIVTALRRGPDRDMLLIVNGNDFEREVRVDLARFGATNAVSRYYLSPFGIATDLLTDARTDRITLGNGESVVYLFPLGSAAPTLERFSADPAGARFLDYRYIYPNGPGLRRARAHCPGQPCAFYLDRRLGDVFYRRLQPRLIPGLPRRNRK